MVPGDPGWGRQHHPLSPHRGRRAGIRGRDLHVSNLVGQRRGALPHAAAHVPSRDGARRPFRSLRQAGADREHDHGINRLLPLGRALLVRVAEHGDEPGANSARRHPVPAAGRTPRIRPPARARAALFRKFVRANAEVVVRDDSLTVGFRT